MKKNNYLIFQYISALINKPVLLKVINRLIDKPNIKIILDLEDAIQDVFEETNNSILKLQARNNLSNFLNEYSDLKVGIRINQINTKEFQEDIKFLNEKNEIKWEYVVLPKVESISEIQEYIRYLNHIEYKEIILCIESSKGLINLTKILSVKFNKISKIQFGHFDFFLDKGIFPIPKQYHHIFWDTCNKIIKRVESNGYTYLHSPVNEIKSDLILSIVNHITKLCENEFGFASISIKQSSALLSYSENKIKPLILKKDNRDKNDYAETIIESFKNQNRIGFSFLYKKKEHIFLPPQEYFSAKKHLASKKIMDNPNIAFIGGCAINQKRIPKKDRFISVLNSELKSNLLVSPKYILSSYSNFLDLNKKTEQILKRIDAGILIIHIRPQLFIKRSKLIIKYLDKDNKVSYSLNSVFYNQIDNETLSNLKPVFNELEVKPTFIELNVFLGRIFNINNKSNKYVFNTIRNLQVKCEKKNIQLVVLGISPQLMSYQGNLICNLLDIYLIKKCSEFKIHYIENFSEMNEKNNFLSDKLHMSINGHIKLGQILYKGLKHFITT